MSLLEKMLYNVNVCYEYYFNNLIYNIYMPVINYNYLFGLNFLSVGVAYQVML